MRAKIKLHTVNVIEFNNGEFQMIRSFADTPKGNKQAERFFARKMREHFEPTAEDEKGRTIPLPLTRGEIDTCIEEGTYEDCGGYQLFLTHSV